MLLITILSCVSIITYKIAEFDIITDAWDEVRESREFQNTWNEIKVSASICPPISENTLEKPDGVVEQLIGGGANFNKDESMYGLDPLDALQTKIDGTTAMSVENIKAYIRETAGRYGVDVELALKIANCESSFRNIVNEEYGAVGGIGIFQIVQSTFDEAVEEMIDEQGCWGENNTPWDLSIKNYSTFELAENVSPYNIKDNIEVAMYLLSIGGEKHWDASRHCWQPELKKSCKNIRCSPWLLLNDSCECVEKLEIKTNL